MIANYMAIGRSREARGTLAALLRKWPDFTMAKVPEIVPFKKKEDIDRFLDLLSDAGLPE
jgi:hypothetical protein